MMDFFGLKQDTLVQKTFFFEQEFKLRVNTEDWIIKVPHSGPIKKWGLGDLGGF